MLKKMIILVALILLIYNASGWEIKDVRYNAENKTLQINFKLNSFEQLLLFVWGGDYTKNIAENFLNGSYEIISAGYDNVCVKVYGVVYFKKPVDILIRKGYVCYAINTTQFYPSLV